MNKEFKEYQTKMDNRLLETRVKMIPPETFKRKEPVPGRNNPCPCGSGKKYKKCCRSKTESED